MNVALFHNHFDAAHLAQVTEEMKALGAPAIRAVWMECYGHWSALEGCHRLRAAHSLGLSPIIVPVEYSDMELLDLDIDDGGHSITVAEIADDSAHSLTLEFPDA